jgi:large subunit ribosomal protein L25
MTVNLAIQSRDAKAAPESVRASGLVPAVLYGPKEAPTPISINAKEFERVFKTAGETTIIILKGVGEDKETVIKDVQFHPVTDTPLHADFYVIEKGKKVTVSIPLEFVGSSPAEKAGHILVKALHEVEIEVAPSELPQQLDVDVSKLENVGDHILVRHLKLPPSAELQIDPKEIVVSVTEFVEEKEPTPAVAETPTTAPAAAAPVPESK